MRKTLSDSTPTVLICRFQFGKFFFLLESVVERAWKGFLVPAKPGTPGWDLEMAREGKGKRGAPATPGAEGTPKKARVQEGAPRVTVVDDVLSYRIFVPTRVQSRLLVNSPCLFFTWFIMLLIFFVYEWDTVLPPTQLAPLLWVEFLRCRPSQ